ncbi:amino acid ABC transporter substrate-binding protein [Ketogulonicigenium vulgare]|uniref:Twin-arginine translocation pathway signal n=1 Tax=Ketogulonicigenium vulgare (strain WSH-001) TaxID=759362 RepID=F9Y8P7_KETVW|nr:amino acid ABC transporter substrate-binding protein [Ketogulonicigenium vulgare]ADO43038.1 twin-arginine translocation pathway signal [Ketogulonicigenium vulgare Y25]AEM41216.1 Twin-arginine translocation pathway signal [Ketogulonicigenium vulgare WSH-001]ALJ81358.1 twin-arginine translocation pathway signal protein [Ketogulonicigenium vulgare]ANW34089.1 twin-arginine translocation pathway signal protein [Ketogulonicigenium vulgare]AOZ54947.1 twin-arginine translocation pathway signal [Ket
MIMFSRRLALRSFGATIAVAAAMTGFSASAQQTSIKIGYAVSLTGGNAGGAGITTLPNYRLWVSEVNAAGGLELPDGTRLPIEVVEYDDRSSTEEVVRAIERLATQDQVDFILSPWGTGFNLAVAPLLDRFGYPQLASASVTDRADEFAQRWPRSFWLLGGGADYAGGLADVLATATASGVMNGDVAIISVADGFGIDLINAARPAFAAAGLNIVMDRTYPPGTTDFSPMLNEAKSSSATAFVAFSYPPDTFALTQQAQVADYNPAVFYLGVGAPFPTYLGANGANAEGVMSLGGIDTSNAAMMDYRARHEAFAGQPPDSWASMITYAGLEILQEAIKRAGLDRDAVSAEIASGSFTTILGETQLQNNQLRDLWLTGQWQDGTFVAIEPTDRPGASAAIVPKQPWAN